MLCLLGTIASRIQISNDTNNLSEKIKRTTELANKELKKRKSIAMESGSIIPSSVLVANKSQRISAVAKKQSTFYRPAPHQTLHSSPPAIQSTLSGWIAVTGIYWNVTADDISQKLFSGLSIDSSQGMYACASSCSSSSSDASSPTDGQSTVDIYVPFSKDGASLALLRSGEVFAMTALDQQKKNTLVSVTATIRTVSSEEAVWARAMGLSLQGNLSVKAIWEILKSYIPPSFILTSIEPLRKRWDGYLLTNKQSIKSVTTQLFCHNSSSINYMWQDMVHVSPSLSSSIACVLSNHDDHWINCHVTDPTVSLSFTGSHKMFNSCDSNNKYYNRINWKEICPPSLGSFSEIPNSKNLFNNNNNNDNMYKSEDTIAYEIQINEMESSIDLLQETYTGLLLEFMPSTDIIENNDKLNLFDVVPNGAYIMDKVTRMLKMLIHLKSNLCLYLSDS